MTDLTTTYLGMKLRTPIVPSASPLSMEIDDIKRMEDAGASAVVLYSLFEEQIQHERHELFHYIDYGAHSHAEALSYFPESESYQVGPEAYLEHIQQAKAAVDIPIIGSLNGSTPGGWTEYARKIEQAGADALELNIYYIPTDKYISGALVEDTYLDTLKAVKIAVDLPVAVKISPFFSNIANMVQRLDNAGADALVLFNRFYQPDINLETLEIYPHVLLSTPMAQRLPLRWIAILYGYINADMAATSGIHTAEDAIKMLMVGANVTMMASALLQRGIGYISIVEEDMRRWMEEHEYDSVSLMQGSMSQHHAPDPSAFERAHYMKALHEFRHTLV